MTGKKGVKAFAGTVQLTKHKRLNGTADKVKIEGGFLTNLSISQTKLGIPGQKGSHDLP